MLLFVNILLSTGFVAVIIYITYEKACSEKVSLHWKAEY